MPAVFVPTEERQVKHWALRLAIAEAEAAKDAVKVGALRAELAAHKAGRVYVPPPPPVPPKPPEPAPSVTEVTSGGTAVEEKPGE